MKLKKTILLGMLGILTFAACVETEDAAVFFFKGNAAITQQEQCVARPNPRTYRASGIVDLWMRNRYKLFPVVESYLAPTEGTDLYGEIHNIQFIGATVTYDYPGNLDTATENALGKEYFYTMAGYLMPGDPGISMVDVIQPEVGNALRDEPFVTQGFEIVANVTIEGRDSAGTIYRSNTLHYPIMVCWQCLYMVVTSDCDDLSNAQDMRPPCLIGQDDGVDCRVFGALGGSPDDGNDDSGN